MSRLVHIILTDYSSGVGLRSPQMPELFAGYPQMFQALAAVPELLTFGGAPENPNVVEHREFAVTTPDDRMLLMRVADDAEFSHRAMVLGAIRRAFELMGGELLETLLATSLDEYVLIAALDTDSLEWLTSQADRLGEPVNLAWQSPDGALHFATVVRGGDVVDRPYELVDDGATTVGELVKSGSMSSSDTSLLQLV